MADFREKIQNELFKIIARLAGTSPDKLKPETNLRDDLGFDSLKSMEAISRITELYDIEPDLDEIADIKILKDIIDYLEKKLSS
ncbi:MAG: phosphopantetheine-binding protein [Spirochaetes bacterium]|jgi:acyl carrier protein|nr:phosphopantetheine-binding protein [Spirochaetota bacterium]